jgi:type-F conjugative transfer system pilin assembly protein TrbC
MLRFIILMLLSYSVFASGNSDEKILLQVQEFAKDINTSLPINPVFKQAEQTQEKQNGAQLIVFISTSMSEKSIKQWAIQADLLGTELVIRGFVNNSFKETVALARGLFEEGKVGGFNIDPLKFKQYSVDVVPTVILDVGGAIDVVQGDIGLIEALELIKSNGINSKDAQNYLSKI